MSDESSSPGPGGTIGPFYALGNYDPATHDYLPLALGDEVFYLEEQRGVPPGFFKGEVEGVGVGYVPWMFTTPVKIMEPLADPRDQVELLDSMVKEMISLVDAGFNSLGKTEDEGEGQEVDGHRTFVAVEQLVEFLNEQQVEWHAGNDAALLSAQTEFETYARRQDDANGNAGTVIFPTGDAFSGRRFPSAIKHRDYAVYVRPGPEILENNLREIMDEDGRIDLDADDPFSSPWVEQLLQYFTRFSYEDIFGVAVEDEPGLDDSQAQSAVGADVQGLTTTEHSDPSDISAVVPNNTMIDAEEESVPVQVPELQEATEHDDSHLRDVVLLVGDLEKLPRAAYPISGDDVQKLKQKRFVKRTFVLTHSSLAYYKSRKKFEGGAECQGRVAISRDTSLLTRDLVPETLHTRLDPSRCILLQSSEVMLALRPLSSTDRRKWYTQLSKAIDWAERNSVHVKSATDKTLRADDATLRHEREQFFAAAVAAHPGEEDVVVHGGWTPSQHAGFGGILTKVNEMGQQRRCFARIEHSFPDPAPELAYYFVSSLEVPDPPPISYEPPRSLERHAVVLNGASYVQQHEDESDLGFMFGLCSSISTPFTFVAKHRESFDEWVFRLEACIAEAEATVLERERRRSISAGAEGTTVDDDATHGMEADAIAGEPARATEEDERGSNPLHDFDGPSVSFELDNMFRTLGVQVNNSQILAAVGVIKSLTEASSRKRRKGKKTKKQRADLVVQKSTGRSVLCVLCQQHFFWCALDGVAGATNRLASRAAAYSAGSAADGGYESGASDDGAPLLPAQGFLSILQRTLVERVLPAEQDSTVKDMDPSSHNNETFTHQQHEQRLRNKPVYRGHGGRGVVLTSPHMKGSDLHRVAIVFANASTGIFETHPPLAERLNQSAGDWMKTLHAIVRQQQTHQDTIYTVLRAAAGSENADSEHHLMLGDQSIIDGAPSNDSSTRAKNPYKQRQGARDGLLLDLRSGGAAGIRHAHATGELLAVGIEFMDFSALFYRKYRRTVGLRLSVQNLPPEAPDRDAGPGFTGVGASRSQEAAKAHFARLIHETLESTAAESRRNSIDDDAATLDSDGVVGVKSMAHTRSVRCNWREMVHSDFIFPAAAPHSARYASVLGREMHLVFEFFVDESTGDSNAASPSSLPRNADQAQNSDDHAGAEMSTCVLARLAVPLASISKEPKFHRLRVPALSGTGADGRMGTIICSTAVLSSMTLRLKSMLASAARDTPADTAAHLGKTATTASAGNHEPSVEVSNLCSYALNPSPRRRIFCYVEQVDLHLRFKGAAVSSGFDVDDYPLGPELLQARFEVACGSPRDPPNTYSDDALADNVFTSGGLSGRFTGHEISGTGSDYAVVFSFAFPLETVLEMYWQNTGSAPGSEPAADFAMEDERKERERREPEVLWLRLAGAFAPGAPLACKLSTAWTPLRLVNDVKSLACRTVGLAHLHDVGGDDATASNNSSPSPDISLEVTYTAVDPHHVMAPYRKHLNDQDDLAVENLVEDGAFGDVSLEQLVGMERFLLVNVVEAKNIAIRSGGVEPNSAIAARAREEAEAVASTGRIAEENTAEGQCHDARKRQWEPDFQPREWDVVRNMGVLMDIEPSVQFRVDSGVSVIDDASEGSSDDFSRNQPRVVTNASVDAPPYNNLCIFPPVMALNQAPSKLENTQSKSAHSLAKGGHLFREDIAPDALAATDALIRHRAQVNFLTAAVAPPSFAFAANCLDDVNAPSGIDETTSTGTAGTLTRHVAAIPATAGAADGAAEAGEERATLKGTQTRLQRLLALQDSIDAIDMNFEIRTLAVVATGNEDLARTTVFNHSLRTSVPDVSSDHPGEGFNGASSLRKPLHKAAEDEMRKGRRVRLLCGSAQMFNVDYTLNSPVDQWISLKAPTSDSGIPEQAGQQADSDDLNGRVSDVPDDEQLQEPKLRVVMTYFVPALMPPEQLVVPADTRTMFIERHPIARLREAVPQAPASAGGSMGNIVMLYIDRLTALPQTMNAHGGSTRLVIVARQHVLRHGLSDDVALFSGPVQAPSKAGANVVLSRELLRAPSTAAGGGGYQWEQSAANSLVLPTTTCNGWPTAVSVEVFALHRPDPKYDAECLLGYFPFQAGSDGSISAANAGINDHVLPLTPSSESRFRAAVADVNSARDAACSRAAEGLSAKGTAGAEPPRLQPIRAPATFIPLEEFFNPSELAYTTLEGRSCAVDLELLSFHFSHEFMARAAAAEERRRATLQAAVRRLQRAWLHRRAHEWDDDDDAPQVDEYGNRLVDNEAAGVRFQSVVAPFVQGALRKASEWKDMQESAAHRLRELCVRRVQNAFAAFRATALARNRLAPEQVLALPGTAQQRRRQREQRRRARRERNLDADSGGDTNTDSEDEPPSMQRTGGQGANINDSSVMSDTESVARQRKSTVLSRLTRAMRLTRLHAAEVNRDLTRKVQDRRDAAIARVQLAWLSRGIRHFRGSYADDEGVTDLSDDDWSRVRQGGTAPPERWNRLGQFFHARHRKLEAKHAIEAQEREQATELMVRRVQSAWLLGQARRRPDSDNDDTSMLDLVWARIRKAKQKKGDYLRQMALVLQMAYRRREALVEYNQRVNEQPSGNAKTVPKALVVACVQRVKLAWVRWNRRTGSSSAFLKYLRRSLLQQKVQSTSGVGALLAQRLQEMYIARKSSLTYRSCYVVTVFAARGIPLHCRRGNFVRLKLLDRYGKIVGVAQQTSSVHDLENPIWISASSDAANADTAAALAAAAAHAANSGVGPGGKTGNSGSGGLADGSSANDVEVEGLHFVFPHLPAFHRHGAVDDVPHANDGDDEPSDDDDAAAFDGDDDDQVNQGALGEVSDSSAGSAGQNQALRRKRRRRRGRGGQPMFVFELYRETDDGDDIIGSARYPTRAVGFGKRGGGEWIPVNAKDAAVRVALSWVDMSRYGAAVFEAAAEQAADAWRQSESVRLRALRNEPLLAHGEQEEPTQWRAVSLSARVRATAGGAMTRKLSPGEVVVQVKSETVGGRLWVGFRDGGDVSLRNARDPDSRLAKALQRLRNMDPSIGDANSAIPAPLRWVAVTSRRAPYALKLTPLDVSGHAMPKYKQQLKQQSALRARHRQQQAAPQATHLLLTIPAATGLPEFRTGAPNAFVTVDFLAQRRQPRDVHRATRRGTSGDGRRSGARARFFGRRAPLPGVTTSSSSSDGDDAAGTGGDNDSEVATDSNMENVNGHGLSFVRKAIRLDPVGPTTDPCWMESRARCSFIVDLSDVNLRGLTEPRIVVSVRDAGLHPALNGENRPQREGGATNSGGSFVSGHADDFQPPLNESDPKQHGAPKPANSVTGHRGKPFVVQQSNAEKVFRRPGLDDFVGVATIPLPDPSAPGHDFNRHQNKMSGKDGVGSVSDDDAGGFAFERTFSLSTVGMSNQFGGHSSSGATITIGHLYFNLRDLAREYGHHIRLGQIQQEQHLVRKSLLSKINERVLQVLDIVADNARYLTDTRNSSDNNFVPASSSGGSGDSASPFLSRQRRRSHLGHSGMAVARRSRQVAVAGSLKRVVQVAGNNLGERTSNLARHRRELLANVVAPLTANDNDSDDDMSVDTTSSAGVGSGLTDQLAPHGSRGGCNSPLAQRKSAAQHVRERGLPAVAVLEHRLGTALQIMPGLFSEHEVRDMRATVIMLALLGNGSNTSATVAGDDVSSESSPATGSQGPQLRKFFDALTTLTFLRTHAYNTGVSRRVEFAKHFYIEQQVQIVLDRLRQVARKCQIDELLRAHVAMSHGPRSGGLLPSQLTKSNGNVGDGTALLFMASKAAALRHWNATRRHQNGVCKSQPLVLMPPLPADDPSAVREFLSSSPETVDFVNDIYDVMGAVGVRMNPIQFKTTSPNGSRPTSVSSSFAEKQGAVKICSHRIVSGRITGLVVPVACLRAATESFVGQGPLAAAAASLGRDPAVGLRALRCFVRVAIGAHSWESPSLDLQLGRLLEQHVAASSANGPASWLLSEQEILHHQASFNQDHRRARRKAEQAPSDSTASKASAPHFSSSACFSLSEKDTIILSLDAAGGENAFAVDPQNVGSAATRAVPRGDGSGCLTLDFAIEIAPLDEVGDEAWTQVSVWATGPLNHGGSEGVHQGHVCVGSAWINASRSHNNTTGIGKAGFAANVGPKSTADAQRKQPDPTGVSYLLRSGFVAPSDVERLNSRGHMVNNVCRRLHSHLLSSRRFVEGQGVPAVSEQKGSVEGTPSPSVVPTAVSKEMRPPEYHSSSSDDAGPFQASTRAQQRRLHVTALSADGGSKSTSAAFNAQAADEATGVNPLDRAQRLKVLGGGTKKRSDSRNKVSSFWRCDGLFGKKETKRAIGKVVEESAATASASPHAPSAAVNTSGGTNAPSSDIAGSATMMRRLDDRGRGFAAMHAAARPEGENALDPQRSIRRWPSAAAEVASSSSPAPALSATGNGHTNRDEDGIHEPGLKATAGSPGVTESEDDFDQMNPIAIGNFARRTFLSSAN